MLFKNLTIVITLAPRWIPTVNECIKSLRDSGINNKVYIVAEPGEYIIEDENTELIIHETRKWCFVNYDWVLKNYGHHNEYLWILQDDFEARNGIIEWLLDATTDKKYWFYDMFLHRRHSKQIEHEGRNNISAWWHSCGACYVFHKPMIDKILEHPFYKRHLTEYVVKVGNQQVDACIGETCSQLKLRTYYPSYSYVRHMGKHSTINHADRAVGEFLRFEKEQKKEQEEKIRTKNKREREAKFEKEKTPKRFGAPTAMDMETIRKFLTR